MTSIRQTLKDLNDRGDLIPWINGETVCLGPQGNIIDTPHFHMNTADRYTFRTKPAPPVLRPWTLDEIKLHKDCWFRNKPPRETMAKIMGLIVHSSGRIDVYIGVGNVWQPDTMLEHLEYLDTATNEWKPCGTLEQAQ